MALVNKYSAASNTNIYLYTKGGEYSLNGEDYIGEYHMEGTTAKTGPMMSADSVELQKAYRNPDVYVYDRNFKFKVPVTLYIEPRPYIYNPTEQAYSVGIDTRYFVEKFDDDTSYAIEIDSMQYSAIGKIGGIDGGLYRGASIQWQLTGRRDDIINNNQLEITKALFKIPTLDYSIKNYLEFARITLV